MEKCGGLWLNEGKKGKFFSGKIEIKGEKHSILIFKNKYKGEGTKQPDYQIFLGDDKKPVPEKKAPEMQYDDAVPF